MVASYLDVVAHLQESYLAQEFKMQRIQSAIAQSRCVFVFGSGLVGSSAEAELSKKGLSTVSLTADTSEQTLAFNADNLAPATNNQGIIVLVEPDFGEGHLERSWLPSSQINLNDHRFLSSRSFTIVSVCRCR